MSEAVLEKPIEAVNPVDDLIQQGINILCSVGRQESLDGPLFLC